MKWTEIAEGHYVSQTGCHVVDGDLKDPCAKCKGLGRRGRGRCGACSGDGETRRRFAGLPNMRVYPLQCGLEKAKAIQERKNNPGVVYTFYSSDNDKWTGVLTPMDLI